MPCSSKHMSPSTYETGIKETVGLLCYVYGWLDIDLSPELRKAGDQLYFDSTQGDKWVAALCTALTNMPEDERDQLVYATRCRMSRRLADWWEDHVATDIQKLAFEKRNERRKAIRALALGKLTNEEKKALGLTVE